MKEHVKISLITSLVIQWLSLFINLFGLFQSIPAKDFILKEILGLETLVQAIELGFYTWYNNHIEAKVSDVTVYRYYDWLLTTPLMLFSTMGFYGYINHKNPEPLRLFPFYQENSSTILFVLFMNLLMLIFGYLQELNLLSLTSSTVWGFASLFTGFATMYTNFVAHGPYQFIFFFVFFVWSLYGIAAMFENHLKNISYNVLDIFAKNFYGVYLSYFIYSLSRNV
jgi:bacteriorhodopsin